MAGVAEVKAFERGDDGPTVKVDRGGGDNATVDHYEPSGSDSQPLPGDTVALGEDAEAGTEYAAGYHDTTTKKAGPGEKRIYGRTPGGQVAAEVWCKADGTVVITNLLAPAGGAVEVGADGTITLNGVKIDAQGNVSAPGEVTAKATSAAVALSTHVHPTALGPSGPPTPSP